MLEKLISYISLHRIRSLYAAIGILASILMIYSAATLFLFFNGSSAPTHSVTASKIVLPLHVVPQNTSQVAVQEVATQAEIPPINLTLTGIIFSKNTALSRAFLQGPEGQKSYANGSSLEKHPDVVVVQIRPDAVVLNNRGKEQTLMLPPSRSKGENHASPPMTAGRFRQGNH